jgi:predicted DNA-binding transcriptional regulator YafY
MRSEPVQILVNAIDHKRLIRFLYQGKERIVEPHDYGIRNGSPQLLGYQVGGSSSRPMPCWVTFKADEINDLTVLETTFQGGRPTQTGKHIAWETLFIRVAQPNPDAQ